MSRLLLCVLLWGCAVSMIGRDVDGQEVPSGATTGTTPEESPEARSRRIQEWMQQMQQRTTLAYDAQMQALATVESVSLAKFEGTWRTSINVENQPAQEVVRRLVTELGLHMANEQEHQAALQRPVTLRLQGVSRLQILEAVCNQVELYPDYYLPQDRAMFGRWLAAQEMAARVDSPSADRQDAVTPARGQQVLVLRAGARPFPLSFTGPFAVEIRQVDEFPPHAWGQLRCCLFAGGVPTSVADYWDVLTRQRFLGWDWPLWKSEWVNTSGHSSELPGTRVLPSPGETVLPGLNTMCILRNLVRDVESVVLSSQLNVAVPVSVETARFDDLQAIPVTQGTRMKITIAAMTSSADQPASGLGGAAPPHRVSYTIDGDKGVPVAFLAFDVDGKALHVDDLGNTSPYAQGGPQVSRDDGSGIQRREGSFNVAGRPTTLVAKAFLAVENLHYPFEIPVQLRRSSAQPIGLTPLQFAGDAPLSVRMSDVVEEAGHRFVTVRVQNESNKDVMSVHCSMQLLDDSGKVVSSQSISLHAVRAADESIPFSVFPAHAASEARYLLHGSQPPYASIQFAVESVTFADQAQWPSLRTNVP